MYIFNPCSAGQQPPPENIQVLLIVNGTEQISWDQPLGVCAASNISYHINLTPADGNPIEEGIRVPLMTEETNVTFNLTPGREYWVLLTARNADCSISSCTIQQLFTAAQNPGNQ